MICVNVIKVIGRKKLHDYLPSEADREKYISDINQYIDDVKENIKCCKEYHSPKMLFKREELSLNYKPISSNDEKIFNEIVKRWEEFLENYKKK